MHICGLTIILFYKVLQLFFSLFLILSIYSCKDSPVNPPPDNKPPGYQEDIPWPSLADSPWPASNADMQRTGRSKYNGPQQGVITAALYANQMQTGIAFGNDSIFYYGTSSRWGSDSTKLIAAKIDGTILWTYDLWAYETMTTPLIDDQGTIYTANGFFCKIFAINPDGTLKWTYETEREVFNRGLGMGKDGTLYAVENGSTLLAIGRYGNLLWKYQDVSIAAGSKINLAFSPDGKTLYMHGSKVGNDTSSVIAFDLTSKSIKWKFGKLTNLNGVMVDSKGNIYVMYPGDSGTFREGTLFCLNHDGTVKWYFNRSIGYGVFEYIDPTIDKDGNIYFATDTLYALDYNGRLKWQLFMGEVHFYGNLICDAQGTVYLARNFSDYNWTINAISKDGILKWSIPITDELGPGECPAITKNGTLVFPSWRSRKLFIIK
jgi:large repetitive protein